MTTFIRKRSKYVCAAYNLFLPTHIDIYACATYAATRAGTNAHTHTSLIMEKVNKITQSFESFTSLKENYSSKQLASKVKTANW